MNTLDRPGSVFPGTGGLLGSQEALESLKKAKTARLLVLSDTHGHYAVLEEILRQFGGKCDALLFAGDGMWDIVRYLENMQVSSALALALPPVVAFVAGNGDGDQYHVGAGEPDFSSETSGMPSDSRGGAASDHESFTLGVPSRLVLGVCGFNIFLVHGHRFSVEQGFGMLIEAAREAGCSIAVFGHTHIPFSGVKTRILMLNPGSPSRPRGNTRPSFAILELESGSVPPRAEFYTVN
jgi:putative phosphoesterase